LFSISAFILVTSVFYRVLYIPTNQAIMMHKQSLIFVAGLGAAYADFLINTETAPVPTVVPAQLSAAYSALASGKPELESLLSQKSAMDAQIQSFVSTATQFEIPPEVTDPSKIATFTTIPEWYSALPKEVLDYHSKAAAAVSSVASELGAQISQAPNGTANGTLKVDPSPSPSATGGDVAPTGAAGRMAVGMGGVLAGVAALGFVFL
jgi:hypothetical protein